jgi:CubicO group peptidase (beta-lactamase class C family)
MTFAQKIEILSGLTLEEFMQKNIFAKLDMRDTTFRPEHRDTYLTRKMEHATRDPKTGALIAGGGHHLLALPAKDCIGGMGLYSTPSDLVKVLKEILAGGGNIVKRESVAEMLKSQLNEETNAAFMAVIDGRAKYHLRQTWPDGSEGTFGLSSSINLNDFAGRRLKNSSNWAGSSGMHAVSILSCLLCLWWCITMLASTFLTNIAVD